MERHVTHSSTRHVNDTQTYHPRLEGQRRKRYLVSAMALEGDGNSLPTTDTVVLQRIVRPETEHIGK